VKVILHKFGPTLIIQIKNLDGKPKKELDEMTLSAWKWEQALRKNEN